MIGETVTTRFGTAPWPDCKKCGHKMDAEANVSRFVCGECGWVYPWDLFNDDQNLDVLVWVFPKGQNAYTKILKSRQLTGKTVEVDGQTMPFARMKP